MALESNESAQIENKISDKEVDFQMYGNFALLTEKGEKKVYVVQGKIKEFDLKKHPTEGISFLRKERGSKSQEQFQQTRKWHSKISAPLRRFWHGKSDEPDQELTTSSALESLLQDQRFSRLSKDIWESLTPMRKRLMVATQGEESYLLTELPDELGSIAIDTVSVESDGVLVCQTPSGDNIRFSMYTTKGGNEEVSVRARLESFSPELLGFSEELILPHKDNSGFVIGGVNSNEVIKNIEGLGEVPIAVLENRMRPEYLESEYEGSTSGFLGPDESFTERLQIDNSLREEAGMTFQEISWPLLYAYLAAKKGFDSFILEGESFQTQLINEGAKTPQGSPIPSEDVKPGYGSVYLDRWTQNGVVRDIPVRVIWSELGMRLIAAFGFCEGEVANESEKELRSRNLDRFAGVHEYPPHWREGYLSNRYRYDPRATLEIMPFLAQKDNELFRWCRKYIQEMMTDKSLEF